MVDAATVAEEYSTKDLHLGEEITSVSCFIFHTFRSSDLLLQGFTVAAPNDGRGYDR
mgnify:CR=1 FL=1